MPTNTCFQVLQPTLQYFYLHILELEEIQFQQLLAKLSMILKLLLYPIVCEGRKYPAFTFFLCHCMGAICIQCHPLPFKTITNSVGAKMISGARIQ